MNTFTHQIAKALIRRVGTLMGPRPATPPHVRGPRDVAYFIGGGIGDAVMAYPALRFLRKHLPHANIDVYVPEAKAPILSAMFGDFPVQGMTPGTTASLLARTLGRPYDVAFTNTIAAFSAGFEACAWLCSRRALGFRYPDESPEDRLYLVSKAIVDARHDIDQNLELVAEALRELVAEQDRFHPRADRQWQRNGPPVVLVHPGAEVGYARKLWPLDNYRAIAQRLSEEGCSVKVIIGPSEGRAYDALKYIPKVDFLVHPDPQTLIHEFRQADLFVGNDSGPAHMASFYGVPGVTLIGPVDPRRTAPRLPESVSLYSREHCSPCHFTGTPCADNKCMKNITVAQVWEVVSRMLENGLLR